MAFHTFTKPVDYVLPKATSRSNFVFDSDLVAGKVRLLLDYQGGPLLATFGAPDNTMILDLPFDRGLQSNGSVAKWNSGNPWKILGNKLACPGAGYGYMAHHLGVGTANIDVSVDASAVNGEAGLAFRNGSNSTSGPNGTGGNGKVTVTVIPPGSTLAYPAGVKGHVVAQEDFNTYRTFLWQGTSAIVAGTSYTLRVTVVGNTYSVYLNGVLEGTFTSAANATSVDHGVVVSIDDAARLDNYSVVRTTLPIATTYTVRNYEGDVLTSGSITTDVVDITDSLLKQRNNLGPYGWYRVYITGPDHNDAAWGTAYGDCTFMRLPTSSLPANAAATTPRVSGGDGDEIARGVMGLGTVRYSIQNSATAAATTIAEVLPRMAAEKTWQTDTASAARPRNLLVAFPNGTTGNEANVTAIVAGLKDYVKVWETRNEPNYYQGATFWTQNEFAAFHTAVKAGDATATVIGPGSVSFRDGPGSADILYFDQFLAAGGANSCEAFSFHPYNCYNGDISTMRYTLGHLISRISAVGKSAYDLWMTEQGYGWAYAGIVWPHYATRWTSLMYFGQSVITADKMRPETTAYWYDQPIGFDDFPMMWLLDSGPGPTMGPVRTMAAELFGKTFTSELNFGAYGKNIYLGGVWTNSGTGDKVLGLQASSYGANPVRLKVTGATTFTLVDPWGNTSTLTAASGDLSVPASELPQWLRIPSGSTAVLEPTDWSWGTNVCLAGTPATSCPSSTNLAHINNDVHENPYSMGFTPESFCFTAPATSGPHDMTFPQTVDITFSSQTVNRVTIYCNAPWQPLLGTLVDFDLQTFNGSTWTTRKTWTGDITKSFVFTSGEARCRMETYWQDQYIFDYQFPAPLTIQGVRCLIRNASWTGFDTETTSDSFGGNGQNGYQYKVTIREIQAFNYTAAGQAAVTNAPAGLAAGTGTAYNPTVTSSGTVTNAAAALASGTGAAYNASVSVTTTGVNAAAALASGLATAYNPTGVVSGGVSAGTKISQLISLPGANLANVDEFVVVDKSDTTMGATGTDKKVVMSELYAAIVARAPVREFSGTGSPNSVVVASVGDRYWRTDGGAGTTLYVKESGTNTNTGWVGK